MYLSVELYILVYNFFATYFLYSGPSVYTNVT